MADYLAWSVHATIKTEGIRALDEELQGFARLVLVGLVGSTMSCEDHRAVPASAVDDGKWCIGLTAMRELMCEQTDARVVLGGKLANHKSVMPGADEQALLAIKAQQPVFLVDDFGGCARDSAETLGIAERWVGSRGTWEGRQLFDGYRDGDLNNDLKSAESRQLAVTQHIDQVTTLVMTGLQRLRRGPHP